jgi:hypothetical protein
MSSHQRIILWLSVVGFGAFGLAAALYGYLIKISPMSPDPQSGRLYSMIDHGYIFFVTAHERFSFFALLATSGILVLIATALSFYWKDIPRPKSYRELLKHLTNR